MEEIIIKKWITKQTLELVELKDGDSLSHDELLKRGLFKSSKDGNIYKPKDYLIYAYVLNSENKSLKLPKNPEINKYGKKIDKIAATINRFFIYDEFFSNDKSTVSMTKIAAYMLICLHFEGIDHKKSLSRQYFDMIKILIERGHFMIPIHVTDMSTGKSCIPKNFKLSKYGEIKTKEDFIRVILAQFKHFSEIEVTEDFDFDILIRLAFLKFRDYLKTLYSTDYREKNEPVNNFV